MIEFIYYGKPATAGSKRAIPYQKKAEQGGGLGVRVMHMNERFKPFSAEMKALAHEVYDGPPLSGPISLWLTILRARPKGHLKKSGTLRDGAPLFPTQRPDSTKILRAVEDSLTGVLWKDDSQIVRHYVCKDFGEQDALVVRVQELGP